MVEAVVVAAGFSSRAGGWKPGFTLGGMTVIERCIRGMIPFCSRIIVVGGYNFDLLSGLLRKYTKVKLVHNRNYALGMFSSVKTGIRLIQKPRFFFIPGDYPLVSKRVYELLLPSRGAITVPSYRGKPGHPVLFQDTIIPELVSAPDHSSLWEFIQSHSATMVNVDDPGILMDIDTPADHQYAIRYLNYDLPD